MAHYDDRQPKVIRALVCDAMHRTNGATLWNGKTHAEWIRYERQQSWHSYVRTIKKGQLWPGIIGIQHYARMMARRIHVSVKEGENSYKRVVSVGDEYTQQPVIRLDFQNQSHYEPLIAIEKNSKEPLTTIVRRDIQKTHQSVRSHW